MLRRSPLRRRVRIGLASRRRVEAGGKLAVGRPSDTRPEWRARVERCLERANGRCERCGSRRALDPHHVVRRSAGGADSDDNVVMLCRYVCHRHVDAAYRNGKLLIWALGGGRFCFRLVQAPNKWAPITALAHEHSPTSAWLGAQGRPVATQFLGSCSTTL